MLSVPKRNGGRRDCKASRNNKKPRFQPLSLAATDPEWQAIAALLPDDDIAKAVERQVGRLDRSVLDRCYRGCGSPAYDPLAMLRMALYQISKGNLSPATWHQEACHNRVMQWLGRGYQPSRRAFYNFRDRLFDVIDEVHQQIVVRACAENHLDPTIGVQDGTAQAACASRHRMVNRKTLDERLSQLSEILGGAFAGDMPRWVPRTERGRRQLELRMKEASEVLDERIRKNAGKSSGKRQDPGKIQVSLSDPAAPLGRDKMKVFRPLYTVQLMAAPQSHLIMSYSCDPQVTDAGTLAPMIDKTQAVVGGRLRAVMADAAYCSIVDLQECVIRGIELLAPVQANSMTEAKKKARPNPQLLREQFQWNAQENCYQCPQGQRLRYIDRMRKTRHSGHVLWEYRYRADPAACRECPLRKSCLNGSASRTIKRLEGQELLDAQREKMKQPEVKQRYKLRSQTVELAFADSKQNRAWTRFHGRGLKRVHTETALVVVAHNIQRLDRLERNAAIPNKSPT